MKLRLFLAAATCMVLPIAAHAQPVTGPYVSAGGGFSIENPVNGTVQGNGFPSGFLNDKFQFRADYAGLASVGYGFGDGFRVELSSDFMRNTVHDDDYNFANEYGGQARDTGTEEKYGAMANALYDVPVGLPVFPYLGAGVGYQWAKLNRPVEELGGLTAGGTKGSFAYDVIVGLSYPIPSLPQLSVTTEYRFMMLTESRNYPTNVPGYYEHLGQESSHTFTIGLRYQLFAPPAPPPATMATAAAATAAPAPVPAKTYLVFFDWDKSNLTPRATQIIAEAAADSHSTAVTTINVSGYTDTSGTPTYNMGLSERRASAVAAQLVTDGVPASEIETHAFGETHLLVPTGPGVREPQNRRVEIVLN